MFEQLMDHLLGQKQVPLTLKKGASEIIIPTPPLLITGKAIPRSPLG
jgi:hypothetical protein